MTTIAYRYGVMACDSQVTDGDNCTKSLCATKIHRINGVLIGVSGDADEREALRFFSDNQIRTPKGLLALYPEFKAEYRILVAFKTGEIFEIHSTGDEGDPASILPIDVEEFHAVGSGRAYAIAAMKAHREVGAEQAVQTACNIDLYSQPPIKTLRFE